MKYKKNWGMKISNEKIWGMKFFGEKNEGYEKKAVSWKKYSGQVPGIKNVHPLKKFLMLLMEALDVF